MIFTPISTEIANKINKANQQYQEGAITACELIAHIHSLTTEVMDEFIKEYEIEQAYAQEQYSK